MRITRRLIIAMITFAAGLLVGILGKPEGTHADGDITHSSEYRRDEAHRLNEEERRAWQKQNYYYEQEQNYYYEQKQMQSTKVTQPAPSAPPPQAIEYADLDKLAYAVAMAETLDCQEGYGAEYNNCFGIRNGSIAPCEKIGRAKMCIYDTPEQSYEAFKAIRSQGYGGVIPQWRHANTWTGGDRVETWLANVMHHYNNF